MSAVKAVLATVAYSNLFRFPLREEEIYYRLLSSRAYSWPTVKKVIALARRRGWLRERSGAYFLPSCSCRPRQRGLFWARRKLARVKKIFPAGRGLPGIKLLAVTGSVASENAYPGDDLDLLFITAPGRLWQTRLWWEGWRRWHRQPRRPVGLPFHRGQRIADRLCPNVWLAGDALRLPPAKQNLFVAMEILQMKVIYDEGGWYARLVAANRDWLAKFLATWLKTFCQKYPCPPPLPRQPLGWREKLAYQVQRLYMARHRHQELVGSRFAFFHPRDQSQLILKRYRRLLSGLLQKLG